MRLPAGKYVGPELVVWCKLYDANRQLLSEHGLSAARVLLEHQTPTSIVPPLPKENPEPQAPIADRCIEPPSVGRATTRRQIAPEQADAQQQQKYGTTNRFLWFHYTPRQVAEWYNAHHTASDLLDFDRSGMTNASEIGRPERTPSLTRTRDGQHWSDFGASARRIDGRPDGGDVLELLVRMSGRCKAEILRELGQGIVKEARAELERAARSGVLPEQWVQDMMSEAGWTRYWRLRKGQA